jgi:hypothetical protein
LKYLTGDPLWLIARYRCECERAIIAPFESIS